MPRAGFETTIPVFERLKTVRAFTCKGYEQKSPRTSDSGSVWRIMVDIHLWPPLP